MMTLNHFARRAPDTSVASFALFLLAVSTRGFLVERTDLLGDTLLIGLV